MNISDLLSSDVFRLFAVVATGKVLEQVRIGRFSFGIASVFLIAAIAGAMGISINASFQSFGLCIFIYAVGIEAGPQFFSTLKSRGAAWISVPLLFIVTALFIYVACATIFRNSISGLSFVGLFAGAFTCTPALAAVTEKLSHPALGIAFGIVYPLTLAGNVYLIPILPKIFGHNIDTLKRIFEEETRKLYGARRLQYFRVTNPSIIGRTIADLRAFEVDGVVFTRYTQDTVTQLGRDEVVLQLNGILAAVGTTEGLSKVEILVGPAETVEVPVPKSLQVRQFVVSNPSIAGKTISKLFMEHPLDIRFTRIARSGIELCPDSDKQILLGDRLTAIGEDEDMIELLSILGDDMEEVYMARFAPISIGIAIGFIVGLIPIPFLSTQLGVTAGVLLVAMILGRKVRFLGILWQIPQATTNFLKQFGLAIFFAVIGSTVGPQIVQTFANHQYWILIPVAIVLGFVPTIAVYAISTKLMKKNPLEVLGLLAGTLNNSSALVAVNDKLKTVIPNTAFAFAYPLGLILVIFATQLLLLVLA